MVVQTREEWYHRWKYKTGSRWVYEERSWGQKQTTHGGDSKSLNFRSGQAQSLVWWALRWAWTGAAGIRESDPSCNNWLAGFTQH